MGQCGYCQVGVIEEKIVIVCVLFDILIVWCVCMFGVGIIDMEVLVCCCGVDWKFLVYYVRVVCLCRSV